MSDERQDLRQTLRELEATSGGSLVRRINKMSIRQECSVLFIGLGGFGSQAVNEIKSIYTKEFLHSDKVRFIVVDTCTADQEDIKATSDNGNMEADECFQIFDPSCINLLTENPRKDWIVDWMGDINEAKIKPVKLNPLGAQGVRQIGRAMLCGTDKYRLLHAKVKGAIDAIHSAATPVHVVILAGLSGGTGSGTFVDVSYMVRSILSSMETEEHTVYQWGVFFTPEAQHSIPEIKSNDTKWGSLKRNGYAALKELDYFMGNGTHAMVHTDSPVYNVRVPDVSGTMTISSNRTMFDPGMVFLVSGNNRTNEAGDILSSTARSVLSFFMSSAYVSENGVVPSSFLSRVSNLSSTDFPSWFISNVGKDVQGNSVPLGVEGAEYPVSMGYRYLSTGYASVYFPRDEVMAYCANKAMERVLAVWQGADALSQTKVMSLLKKCDLSDERTIERKVLVALNYARDDFAIVQESDKPDITRYLFGFGKVENTARSTQAAREMAEARYRQASETNVVNGIANQLADKLKSSISSPQFIANRGPFAAIAALTGYGRPDGSRTRGACEILRDIKLNDLQKRIEALETEGKIAQENMVAAAAAFEADKDPTDAEERAFLETCQDFAWKRYCYLVTTDVLPRVIDGVVDRLMEFNNQTFDIYVPVIEALAQSLNKDATILATTSHSYEHMTHVFGMDAYGLGESSARRARFTSLFDGYVSEQRAYAVANGFAQLMFGGNYRSNWKSLAGDPAALADAVRAAFNNFFGSFVNEMLEKLAVLAWCDEQTLGQLTADRLDRIWSAPQGTQDYTMCRTALVSASQRIATHLKAAGAPLIEFEHGVGGHLHRQGEVTLLQGMDRLNPLISEIMAASGYSVSYVGVGAKSVVRCVTYVFPIALPLVQGCSEWADAYHVSEGSTDTMAGRHLDEYSQDWVTLLPEPFGVDANAYWEGKDCAELVVDEVNDRKILQRIEEALRIGRDAGYIYRDDANDRHVLITNVRQWPGGQDMKSGFCEACQQVYSRNINASLRDCLGVAQNDHKLKFDELPLVNHNNGPLQARESEMTNDPYGFSNLCRIVRSDMGLCRAVLAAHDEWFGSSYKDGNGVLDVVYKASTGIRIAQKNKDKLRLFLDMYRLGMLKWEDGRYEGDGSWWYMSDWSKDEPDEVEWTRLCDLTNLQEGPERTFALYLAYAYGFWNMELSSDDLEWIDELVSQRKKAHEFLPSGAAEPFRHLLDTAPLKQVSPAKREDRDSRLLAMARRSEYADSYDVPEPIENGADVRRNIMAIYKALIDELDYKF